MQKSSGDIGRNDLRIHWWVQYELAARKIQRQFRSWYTARHFRRNYSRKQKMESQRSSIYPVVEDSFRNIIADEGTFEDKMAFWRGAIEVRRAHKAYSTDMIVRAMIETAGDVNRSTVLLGTKEFTLVNKNDLPMKLRKIFIPRMTPTKDQVAHHELMMSSLRKTLDLSCLNDNEIGINGNARLSGVNLIRNLRGTKGKQITYQQDREERRTELYNILNSTLERSYFSRNHIGHKDYKKNQRVAGQSTPKSKEYINKHTELFYSDNMDYLLAKPQGTAPLF